MRKSIAIAAVAMLAAPWAVTHAQQEERDRYAEARVEGGAREQGEPNMEERLSGTWELSGSRDQAQARVNRAIDEAASHVSWIKRSFARSRLREKNPVRDRVRTEVSGENVTIEYGDMEYTTRESQWQTVTALGEPTQLLQQVVGDSIYQTFRSEEGEKVTIYRISEDGNRLTLDIIVTSPQLPEPLRYELSYRRTGGGGAVASR